ncbi:MAG TPA: NB-ARC domain-containing protein, partial [Ktedonobacteraceae bacterium]
MNSLGSLTILLSTIFAAIGVVLGFLQLVPLFFPAKQPDISTPPIFINIPPSQMPMEGDKSTFRGIQAMPPPTDPETILPRKKDVQEVHTRLTQSGTTAIVLTGIGGIGKSTLAALVFNYVEEQRLTTGLFSGKSLWFSIDEKTSFLDLAGNLFDALDRPLPDFSHLAPQNQAEVLFTLLNTTDRSCLVVLDQFENLLDWNTGHALAERPGVSEWLDAINSQHCTCRILLTCRLWPHGTREFPPTCLQEFPVKDLEVSEGMELLRKQGVNASQATDSELRAAVMRFDAHALALSLLASILRHNRSLKLKDLLEEQTYSHAWHGDIARNLLDYIYKVQLDHMQRQLLLAFSVFRVPVQLEAVQALMKRISPIQL